MIKFINSVGIAALIVIVLRTVFIHGWVLDIAAEALVFFAILEVIHNKFPEGMRRADSLATSTKRVGQEALIFLTLRFLVGQLLGLPLIETWEAFRGVRGATGFWKAHEVSAIFAFDVSFAMATWMFMNKKRSSLAWGAALLLFIFGVRATGNTVVGVTSATRMELKAIAEAAMGEPFDWTSNATSLPAPMTELQLRCNGGEVELPMVRHITLIVPPCHTWTEIVRLPKGVNDFFTDPDGALTVEKFLPDGRSFRYNDRPGQRVPEPGLAETGHFLNTGSTPVRVSTRLVRD